MAEGKRKNNLAEDRTDWAEERTDWADQRTYLAQQRTLAAWLRTSVACIAVGLGVVQFFTEVDPTWLITVLGVIFIFTGGVILVLSYVSNKKVSLDTGTAERGLGVSDRWIQIICGGLFVCAMVAMVLLLLRAEF